MTNHVTTYLKIIEEKSFKQVLSNQQTRYNIQENIK